MPPGIRIGLIGLGKMGGIRAQTIRRRDDTLLVAGTDPHPPSRGFDELTLLPEGSAIAEMLADYAVMREQARDCSRY